MIGNIDYGIDTRSNGEESRPDLAPLPLNLLALIISYVCLECESFHIMFLQSQLTYPA